MDVTRRQYILLGIKTDPTRYHGENASRPALLGDDAAQQLLTGVAADLKVLFPAVDHCAVTMPGALFDQTQVLQPGFPVFNALESLQQTASGVSGSKPGLAGIGADQEQMPLAALQPSERIAPGLLQLLPLVVSGTEERIRELTTALKQHSHQQGQISDRTIGCLEENFRISIDQVRFMAITDLCALLRQQLEHFGFLPLWELLDLALNESGNSLEVSTPSGLRFQWHDGAVHSFFESFDWWAKHGAGAEKSASGQQLQSAYVNWTREYRSYQTTLSAHGVIVYQHLAGLGDATLDDSFLLEESTVSPGQNVASVTEHTADDMGTLAVTVVRGRRQMNFYPLQASGLNDLHRYIRDHGYSGDIAYPGRICYDENSRQLTAEELPC